MKTKFISIILLGASLGLGSCSDYLDMTPTDKASDKLVWSKLEYAEQAVNDFYRYIDYLGVYRDGQCLAGMTEALTDASLNICIAQIGIILCQCGIVLVGL